MLIKQKKKIFLKFRVYEKKLLIIKYNYNRKMTTILDNIVYFNTLTIHSL